MDQTESLCNLSDELLCKSTQSLILFVFISIFAIVRLNHITAMNYITAYLKQIKTWFGRISLHNRSTAKRTKAFKGIFKLELQSEAEAVVFLMRHLDKVVCLIVRLGEDSAVEEHNVNRDHSFIHYSSIKPVNARVTYVGKCSVSQKLSGPSLLSPSNEQTMQF